MTATTEAINQGVQYVETSGGVVPFKHYGDQTGGRRLIAIHGLSASVLDWAGFAEFIDTPFTAVGIPDYLPEDPSLNDLANPVSEVISHVTRNDEIRSDLLGISLGGFIVQQVANRRRDIRKMILAATMPASPFMFFNRSDLEAVAMVSSANRKDFDAAKALGGDFRLDPGLAGKITLLNRPIEAIHHERQQKVLLDIFSIGNIVSANFFTRFRHDILTMLGTDDPLIGYDAARAGARWMGSQLVTFKDGGHLFLFTRPDKSANVINNFRDSRQS